MDGYLVHFFVPEYDLHGLPKHITFVLDTSGSMSGVKIEQLKDAMDAILNDLKRTDYLSIITFDDTYVFWESKAQSAVDKVFRLDSGRMDYGLFGLDSAAQYPIYKARDYVVKEARNYINNIKPNGGTNLNDALREAVKLSNYGIEKFDFDAPNTEQILPMIVFLTDGEPTSGEVDKYIIKRNVKSINTFAIPIYGLAFGNSADFDLIKDISSESGAFAKKIFEASDATVQLKNFYKEISTPLLKDVTFNYISDTNLETAQTCLPNAMFYKGNEFVSVVKLEDGGLPEKLEVRGFEGTRSYYDVIYPCNDPRSPQKIIPLIDGSQDHVRTMACIPSSRPTTLNTGSGHEPNLIIFAFVKI